MFSRPKATVDGKFSSKGIVKAEALMTRVKDKKIAEALAKKANYGLAANTQESYKTAINHIKRCEEETGVSMSLPFDDKKTMEFLGWMEARGLRSRSMSTYLSGVRAYHIAAGFKDPFVRDPMVKLILKGQDNWDKLQDRLGGKLGKLPITRNIMMLIKKNLIKKDWPKSDKRLLWAIFTMAWSGSFRIHELCSRKEKEYDIQTTLLWKDVKFEEIAYKGDMVKMIQVHVKSPKVDRVGAGDMIQVFQLGNFMCPFEAMKKYREEMRMKEDPDLPVFRKSSGMCMTGAEINRKLAILTQEVGKLVPGGTIKSHSFRSGVPSEMAKNGENAEAIQAVGRWNGEAYKIYCKLPLTRRADMARAVGK